MSEHEHTIDLLRHGEPVGGRRYRGQTDDPLSERGWDQMWRAVEGPRPWQAIVTSPLARCAAFAQALGAELGLAPVQEERFVEVGYGEWAGLSPDELRERDPEGFAAFRADPWHNRPADAEPMAAFTERVLAAFREHVQHHPAPLLIVGHAGVIRTVLADALGMPLPNLYRLQVPYAGRVRLHRGPELTRVSHMAPLPPDR